MYDNLSTDSATRKFSRTGTFADLLVKHVRARGGNAAEFYQAADVNRRTYSAIISDPFRPVAKRTAILFALALGLDRVQTDRLLQAAGYALSPAIPADVIVAEAIAEGHCGATDVKFRMEFYKTKHHLK